MNWPKWQLRAGDVSSMISTAIAAALATALPAWAFVFPTRALNTAVKLSATRNVIVSYPVDVNVSSLLLGNAQGTVTLQYADDAGMSVNLVTVMSGTNSTSGVLNIISIGTVTLAGTIPANKFMRISTTVNTGTATFASRQGIEVTT